MKSVGGGGHEHDHAVNEGHASNSHQHNEVWLGLMALGGVCLFFCAEKLLNMIVQWCKRRSEAKVRRDIWKS